MFLFRNKIIDKRIHIDHILLWSFILTLFVGMLTFFSSTLGIFDKNPLKFYSVLESQSLAYVIGISVLLIIINFSNFKFWFYWSIPIYIGSILLSLLTFVPGLRIEHGGAARWINIGVSIQPSDFLKFSLILMLSAFIYRFRNIVNTKKYNFLYFIITIIPIIITFIQKDLGAIAVLSVISMSLYVFNSNTSMKKVSIIICSFLIIVSIYGLFNSYIINRIKDYYSGNSYQTNQALIAVSKGGIFGAGPFQGVQKFNYLPEPQGDSIFGTFAEEFGFIWTSLFLIVYFVFLIRSLYLVRYFKDEFRIMLIVGIVTHFIAQIILNIGSIIKIIPLSGDVLPLFSQGGTSLIVNLLEIGIILSLTMNNTRDYREDIIP